MCSLRSPDPLVRLSRLSVFATFLFFLLVAAGHAQERCGRDQNLQCDQKDCDLEAAEKKYRSASFGDALCRLDPCLEIESRGHDQWKAYELKAKIYVAIDEKEKATEAIVCLLEFQPGFEPDPSSDPPLFLSLVEEARKEESTTQVTAVSKTPEGRRVAPATVVVVTADEIERRGYLDLEELIHDLPGFDVSRGNGDVYSNLYQRGFRADANERTLLLVDGVEQNDLSSQTAHLSRQYPLSNVDRVEVVYGPASTFYGANAYTGVIQIVTRSPEYFLPAGARIGWRLQAAAGSFDTRSLDLTLAGRVQQAAWSVTGRIYRSNEMDLSRFDDWDYAYGSVDYGALLRLTGDAARSFAGSAPASPLYEVRRENGQVTSVELTAEGARLARERDSRALARIRPALGFSDGTDDVWLSSRVRVKGLVLGFQAWRREEGTAPWYTDLLHAGKDQGSIWTPRQTIFSLDYAGTLGKKALSTHFKVRYRQSELDSRDSSIATFRTYFSGGLGLRELVGLCEPRPEEPDADCREGSLEVRRFGQLSTQFASEFTVAYDRPKQRLETVAGLEARLGSIQGDLADDKSQMPQSAHTDFGLFTQATWKPWEARALRIVAGARVDDNRLRNISFGESGLGFVFSPRLALVYTPGDLTFKAIYAEAFQEPSDFEKFSTVPGVRDLPAGRLEPERVHSFELGAGWRKARAGKVENFVVEGAAYQATYSNLVGVRQVEGCAEPVSGSGCPSRFQNLGEQRTRGFQATSAANISVGKNLKVGLFANYTFTEPVDLAGDLRVGDIASHRINAGIDVPISSSWGASVRANYVGGRRTGPGTTVDTNPLSEIPSYVVAHATLSYRYPGHGLTLQLIVKNLFDESYADPGVQTAGQGFAASIPQPGRTFYLRAIFLRRGRGQP